jgi:hypothetical protein
MANTETSTREDDRVLADRPDEGDLELAIYALSGVFEALDWADDVRSISEIRSLLEIAREEAAALRKILME